MPTISVIVPVYKVEPYLHRCVDSILAQTFTDFELILVDDGSPDNCPALCDKYAQQDSRIHVIHQKNGGLSAARNAGIDWVFAYSDSQWLTFVDSDDWIHPEMLARLYYAAAEQNVSISVSGYAETGGEEPVIDADKLQANVWKPENFWCEHNLNALVAWGKLYQKDCFTEIRYPVGKIHEDEFVTYKILFSCDKIAAISAPLYFYFYNADGIMNSRWTLQHLDALEALEERVLFFSERNNDRMVAYTKQDLQLKASLFSMIARANKLYRDFPPKYRIGFRKAIRNIEHTIGVDRYEAIMIHYYPLLVTTQAYIRKMKRILKCGK